MGIYFVAFFLSASFLFVAECQNKGNKKILIVVALLIPILLAGLRKIGIGTDTEVYVNVLYNAAASSQSFIDYLGSSVYSSFQTKSVVNWEIGYNLLVYISTKITGSFQGVLIVTHFLIITLFYAGLRRIEGDFSRTLSMLIFYLMFYASSLNMMRQWIAVAIIFWGFHFLQEHRTKSFFLTVAVAILFHNSAVIGVLIWGCYKYFSNSNMKRKVVFGGRKLDINIYKVLIFCVVGLIALACLNIIAALIESVNSVFARYARLYLSGTISLMPMQIVRRMPIILLLLCNWRKINQVSKDSSFFYGMLVLDVLLSQLASVTLQSSRIGYYFSVYEIVILAEIVKRKRKEWKCIYVLAICIYLIILFYFDNVIMGRAEIVPYLFFFS